MINLPCNLSLRSQMIPRQNVPVQTSQNNFQMFPQPQMVTQQMQTNSSVPFPTNFQDTFKQPFYDLRQADVFLANQQYNPTPNVIPARSLYPQFFQPPPNLPPTIQTQPTGPLPQNVLDQIRNCVSSAAPIFILPGACHQSANQQQANPTNQGGVIQQTGPSTGFNCPPSIYCPPSFYPYPIPMPVFEPFGTQTHGKEGSRGCTCCHKGQVSLDNKNYPFSCSCNVREPEEHRCTATNDDTMCSKRNCPASISLQALASQLLSLPGIISCATTRLILRKVPGSNITSTMEDTMDKALKSLDTLAKDQLLVESRNAQQVNALINLHMTTNLPANIIPLLTLVQLKVNVLKAQVEALINKKVMECQGYGVEVETCNPIDPTVLTMKTNAELRQLLTALRQKECDERVNTNFSPYHSQRVIAEARLNNVQAKIRQVEAEFERRRCCSVPTPTLTSRVIQQFSESRCTFGYAHTNLFEPYVQESSLNSPDPFVQTIRNARKLYLKPYERKQELWPPKDQSKSVSTREDGTSMCKDTGTGEGNVSCSKEKAVESRSSVGDCSCTGTSSEDSFDGDKKKLRVKIDKNGRVKISSVASLRDVSLLKLTPNVITRVEDFSDEDSGKRGTEIVEIGKEIFEKKEGTKTEEEVDVRRKGEEISEKEMKDVKDKFDESVVKKKCSNSDEFDEPLIKKEDSDSDKPGKFAKKKERDDGREDEEIDRGKMSVKSDEDIKREVKIKIEPESPKKIKFFDFKSIKIKKEPESPKKLESFDFKDVKVKKESESPKKLKTFDFKDVKVKKEPESPKKLKTFDFKDVKIKKGPESPKAIKTFDFKDVQIKKEPESSRAEQNFDFEGVQIEVEPQDYDDDYEERSHAAPPVLTKEEEKKPDDKLFVSEKTFIFGSEEEPEASESFTASLDLNRNESNLTNDSKEWQKKPTYEGVSKVQETGSLAPASAQASQESNFHYKTTFTMQINATDGAETQEVTNQLNSNEEGKRENDESAETEKRNVQFVSMMSRVRYNTQFVNFRNWNSNKDNCGILAGREREDRIVENNQDYSIQIKENDVVAENRKGNCLKKKHPSMVSSTQQCEKKENVYSEMFAKSQRNKDEKDGNGTRNFPPLKHAATKTARGTNGISENIFHEKEIESGSSYTVCDRSTSYHCDPRTGSNIVSSIYSIIENQIISASTFLANIPNLQTVMSSFHINKTSKNTKENVSLHKRAIIKKSRNKNVSYKRNDWILFPSRTNVQDGYDAFDENNVSIDEGHSRLRKLKHTIIVDKEKKNYLLIRGSSSVHLRELSRNGSKRPYQSRRSLVIRSRLKNPGHSKHEQSYPFAIYKRSKTYEAFGSRGKKRATREVESSEQFLPLSGIPEDSETSKTSIDSNRTKLSPGRILRNDKNNDNVACNSTAVSNNYLCNQNEQVKNVYNYLDDLKEK